MGDGQEGRGTAEGSPEEPSASSAHDGRFSLLGRRNRKRRPGTGVGSGPISEVNARGRENSRPPTTPERIAAASAVEVVADTAKAGTAILVSNFGETGRKSLNTGEPFGPHAIDDDEVMHQIFGV